MKAVKSSITEAAVKAGLSTALLYRHTVTGGSGSDSGVTPVAVVSVKPRLQRRDSDANLQGKLGFKTI